MIYAYNGLLFRHKKEGNPAICDIIDKYKSIMLKELSQTEKDKYTV